MALGVAVVVPVRSSSSRLPKKHLHRVLGRSFLGWLLTRQKVALERAGLPWPIVVATTTDAADDMVQAEAELLGCVVFRGSTQNVPARLSAASSSSGCEAFVCLDGDDICCSPNAVIAAGVLAGMGFSWVATAGLPLGMNVAAYGVSLIKNAVASYGSDLIETGWTRILSKTAPITIDFSAGATTAEVRLTLDYEADLEMFSAVITRLGEAFIHASDAEVLASANLPEIKGLNSHLAEEYWDHYHAQIKRETQSASGT